MTILTILTKNIDQKNFTFLRNYEGGGSGPLCSKRIVRLILFKFWNEKLYSFVYWRGIWMLVSTQYCTMWKVSYQKWECESKKGIHWIWVYQEKCRRGYWSGIWILMKATTVAPPSPNDRNFKQSQTCVSFCSCCFFISLRWSFKAIWVL